MITWHTCGISVLITSLDLLTLILWILFYLPLFPFKLFRLNLDFEYSVSKQMQIGNDLVRQLVKSSWILVFQREKNTSLPKKTAVLLLFNWRFRASAVWQELAIPL